MTQPIVLSIRVLKRKDSMKKAHVLIANALIWGVVLIACSIALEDAGSFPDIQLLLGAGAVISLIVVATAEMRATA